MRLLNRAAAFLCSKSLPDMRSIKEVAERHADCAAALSLPSIALNALVIDVRMSER
jgi:hypothetical protein